jgi:hypothetical protein
VPGLQIEQQPDLVVSRLTLAGEARGEHDQAGSLESEAMLAVWHVGQNRALDRLGRWPRTMRLVFLQPMQFSCFNPLDPNRERLLELWRTDPASWERADTVCDLAEAGRTIDLTHGATHYCTEALWGADRPGAWFSRQEIEAGRTARLVQYGHHIFGRAA